MKSLPILLQNGLTFFYYFLPENFVEIGLCCIG